MIQASSFIDIVLVETSHPGNIGSAARAMKNMGLSNLILVNPKKFPHGDARALAGNAKDLLEHAKVTKNLKDALQDAKYVFATSSRERSISWPSISSCEAAKKIVSLANQNQKAVIIFGREDSGLTNEELQLSNEHIIIPTDEDYPVLNLAMSVQLLCYEIFTRANQNMEYEWQDFPEYTNKEVNDLIEHFKKVAIKSGTVDPNNPKQILTRIERMFRRLNIDRMEGNFLRGFLSKIEKKIDT